LVLFLIGGYFRPPRKPLEEPVRVEGWLAVADMREIPVGRSKKFAYGNIPGIIVNNEGEMRAFSLHCSHFGCVINWLPHRKVFSCPCHGGEFSSTGRAIGGPPEDPLNQFAIQVRDNRIYVKPTWLT
jgi:cytochrome b6-f complex iron-sulfur subunit